MKKRFALLALLIASLCVISVFNVLAEEQSYDYSEKIGLLSELGIISADTSGFSAPVSRGQFVEAAMKLSGFANIDLGKIPPYTDIVSTDSYYGALSSAYSLGYVDGNGQFKSADNVTFYEACDMLTSILGYVYVWDYYEEKNPVLAANRIGILDGVKATADGSITTGDMIKMLHNTLFTKVMRPNVYYSNPEKFDIGSGDILLTEVFDVYKASGKVEATSLTSIYDDEGCAYNYVKINGLNIRADDNYWDFIGQTVTYYYHSYEGTNTVIYMCGKYSDCVFTIDIEDVVSLGKTSVVYEVGNKEKEKSFVSNATFLYNGKMKDFYAIDTSQIQSGYVSLIDSDGNGKYDVINVTEQVHILVTGVNTTNFELYSEDGTNYNLRAEGGIRAVEVLFDGKPVPFSSIAVGSIASIEETTGDGLNRIRVNLSTKTVEGSLTAKDEDYVTIEGEKYSADTKKYTPKLGDYGKFYFAANGKLVYAELENYIVYGFLYRIIQKNDLSPVRAKIFSDKGRWVEIDVADKITINGERKNADYLLTASELMSGGSIKPQLITYRVNSEKKLTIINTAKTVERYSADEEEAIANATFRRTDLGSANRNIYWRNHISSFNMQAFLDNNSFVFVVPGAEGDFEIDTSGVFLANKSIFLNDRMYYNLCFYDMDEFGSVEAMVIYGNTFQYEDSALVPVLSVGRGMDSEGNVCDVIFSLLSGYKISLAVSPDVEIEGAASFDALNLQPGDVIRYSSDSKGSIGKLNLAYRPDDEAFNAVLHNGIYSTRTLFAGILNKISFVDKKAVVSYSGTSSCIVDLSTITSAYAFNTATDKIRKIDVSELEAGKSFFAAMNYGRVQQIIMYE